MANSSIARAGGGNHYREGETVRFADIMPGGVAGGPARSTNSRGASGRAAVLDEVYPILDLLTVLEQLNSYTWRCECPVCGSSELRVLAGSTSPVLSCWENYCAQDAILAHLPPRDGKKAASKPTGTAAATAPTTARASGDGSAPDEQGRSVSPSVGSGAAKRKQRERVGHVVDGRKGKFFMVENQALDEYLPRVGFTAWSLYCVLVRMAGRDGECFPTLPTVARRMGCSDSTVQRSLKVLERHGLVSVLGMPNKANTYVIKDVTAPRPGAPETKATPPRPVPADPYSVEDTDDIPF